jgi:hypothetical protein
MRKQGTVGRRCAKCPKDAIPGTDPPLCKEHIDMSKTADAGPSTLAELDSFAPEKIRGKIDDKK